MAAEFLESSRLLPTLKESRSQICGVRVGRVARQVDGGLVGSWVVLRGPLLPEERV